MPRPKPADPWVNMPLRLTPAQKATLTKLAEADGITVSDVVRRMIDTAQPGRLFPQGPTLPPQRRDRVIDARPPNPVVSSLDIPFGPQPTKPGARLKKDRK